MGVSVVLLVAVFGAALVLQASAHGFVYQPPSMQYLTYRLRSHADWQEGMPESRRWEPGNARLAPGQQPAKPGDTCGVGYAGEISDPAYAEGLQVWQQWYEGAGLEVPSITPGADLEVRADLVADHGGQTWLEIACSDTIGESNAWLLLERASSDRAHHFMPSNPSIYAWAHGDVKGMDGRKAVIAARWTVPSTFSCPTGRAVGRWIWKVANTCSDAGNLGINTETFRMGEYRDVVNAFRPGQNVQSRCANESPEQFLSCFVFRVAFSATPVGVPDPASSPVEVPAPTPSPVNDPESEPESEIESEPESEHETEPESESESELESEPENPGTMPAVTSAPESTPAVTVAPGRRCPNSAYGQCGGGGFMGSECCPEGHYCKELSSYFSSCYSCQYFPDPHCSESLLASSAKLATSKKHNFLGASLIQEGALIERRIQVEENLEL